MAYYKANTLTAIFCYVFNRTCYLSMAVSHNMAVNLEASDLKKLHDEGKYPTDEKLKETKKNADKSAALLQKKILQSLGWTVLILVVTIAIGYVTKAIHPSLPFNVKYVLSVMGALLLLWGSLLTLGPELKTYKGKALHEVVHSVLKKSLLIMGTLALIVVVAL